MAIQTGPAESPTQISTNIDNIQGNILGGFSQNHQAFLFVQIPDAESGKDWVQDVVDDRATSTEVLQQKEEFRRRQAAASPGQTDADILGDATATFVNLAFTWGGLQALGVSDDDLATFPDDFRQGMRARASIIGAVDDSAPENWIPPFHEDPDSQVHAILIVAADLADDRDAKVAELIEQLDDHGIVLLSRQDGDVREDDPGHEHFGFDDGVSQPGVRDDRVTPPDSNDPNLGLPGQDRLWPGEFVLGYPRQADGEDGPDRGAVDTPGPVVHSGPEWTDDGSYLVYFRLRQDVKGFRTFLTDQAASLQISEDVMGAKLVGRYKSGCPLEVTHFEAGSFDTTHGDPSEKDPKDPSLLTPEKINDFDYHDDETGTNPDRKGANDDDGHRVPRAAHIRKVYPRNELPVPGEAEAERRRILRRGIAFGQSFDPYAPDEDFDPLNPGDNPTGANGDRGLQFVSYQTSLADKFEFLLRAWVNNSQFPQSGDGQDLIISFTAQRDANGNEFRPFRLPLPDGTHDIAAPHRWVFITGGEYFFQPSISALRQLSGD